MIEQKDYVMRIIHEWVRTLIKLIFQKDIDRDEDAEVSLEVMELYRKLLAMIDETSCLTAWRQGIRHISRWLCCLTRSSAESRRDFLRSMTIPKKR